ncbi:saccharopine dehydrogenase NADP-binding domain-containing protein [Xenorhabdus lircayensis]|uniref:Saccharopine dehydrogenase NADP-binding domain-containing protein n=1 Tax=Xenorhabdus lircayensis TaxID=2763499 RepID=A0ABS0U6X2_9GAMM|nr:saccharopine dehydrogenase NADP-binding domain-containing protein [Xenorhabdus lircayensis]MBI6549625.1 saccharopine dehydrogenase NADP-binding domain-containing protein [Xenorhabdus lircayensis]
MKRKSVLVIGGLGAVGRAAVGVLSQLGYQVMIAGRSARPEYQNYYQLDLFDRTALARCCQQVDLVLNTAGPSSLIEDRIAETAFSTAVHYVDVAGDPAVEKKILQQISTSQDHCRSACVLGAGFVPGLAAMLPLYAAAYLQPVTKIRLYTGGIEAFTATSAQDFLVSQQPERQQGKTGYILSGGQFIRAGIEKNPPISTAERAFDALPYFSFEQERVAQKLSLSHLAAYNLLADRSLLLAASADQSPAEQNNAIQRLITLSQRLVEQEGEQQHLLMEAHGLLAGKSTQLRLQIRFNNSYQLTGSIAALVAHQLLKQPMTGLYWLPDIINIRTLLTQLDELSLFSSFSSDILPDDEIVLFQEGEI